MPERMRALIIDDEALARENLQMLVEEFCPEVEVLALAANAKEARTLVEEYSPDLVFLDIMMPGENGFAFLEDYKQQQLDNAYWMYSPVIQITLSLIALVVCALIYGILITVLWRTFMT
jgi:DNA-binding NarL/FixJ family response regulator